MDLPRSAQILYGRLGSAHTPATLCLRAHNRQMKLLVAYLLVKACQYFWLF